MAIKRYSAFPKAPALREPRHQIVYCHILVTRWSVPFCREAVSVFYSPSRLGKINFKKKTDILDIPLAHCIRINTHTHTHTSSSSSWNHTEIRGSLDTHTLSLSLSLSLSLYPPPLAIALGSVHTELIYISPRWSAKTSMSMSRSPQENVVDEFFFTSPAYSLVRLSWMVFEMGSKWWYNCCFEGCCVQDLFKTISNILV